MVIGEKAEKAMLNEIFEQPNLIEGMTAKYMGSHDRIISFPQLEASIPFLAGIKRVILLGCGSSYHAALLGNYYFENIAQINCETEYADEFKSRDPIVEDWTMAVAISQSGESIDTLAAVRRAKERGAFILGITNRQNSTLAGLSDAIIVAGAGRELALAATKTFTTEVYILYFLAHFLAQIRGSKPEHNIPALCRALPEQMRQILAMKVRCERLAMKYRDIKNMLVLGETYEYPIALEAAHKLKETAYVHAEGYPSGELKHGAMALVDERMLVIFLAPYDENFNHNAALLKEVHMLKAKTLFISTKEAENKDLCAQDMIILPNNKPELMSLLTILPMQMLAFYIAKEQGLDIDHPRHLKKFVV